MFPEVNMGLPYAIKPSLGLTDIQSWSRLEGVEDRMPEWLREISHQNDNTYNRIRTSLLKIESTVGKNTDPWKIWLLYLDNLACGPTQIPAYTLSSFSSERDVLEQAQFRVARLISGGIVNAGLTIATFGATKQEFGIAAVGLTISAVAEIFIGRVENRSGSHVSGMVGDIFAEVATSKRAQVEFESILADLGIESGFASNAARKSYSMELQHIRHRVADALTKPALIGAAMVSAGNSWGFLVAALGSLAIPTGTYAHKYDLREKIPAERWAATAKVREFSQKLADAHVRMVTVLRTIDAIPHFLQALLMGQTKINPGIIGAFIGIEKGTEALSGTLSFQRSQTDQIEAVQTLTRLLDLLKSPDAPLITPFNYVSHIHKSENPDGELVSRGDGFILQKFKPKFGSSPTEGLTAHFPANTVVRIVGTRGKGKSVALDAIAQIFNHTGDCFIVWDGKVINVHDLTDDERKMSVVSISMENLSATGDSVMDYFLELTRLISLYPNVGIRDDLRDALDATLVDLCQSDRDLLLNSSVGHLRKNINNSFTPSGVKAVVEAFLQAKVKLIDCLLSRYFKDNEVRSNTKFSTLSRGMKQTVINTVIRGYMQYLDPRILVLDELVEGLDDENVSILITDIKSLIATKKHPPVILWVAHNRSEKVAQVFGEKYIEYDLVTGLDEHEKRSRLIYHMLTGENSSAINPNEIQKATRLIGQVLSFLSIFSAYDPQTQNQFITILEDKIKKHKSLSDWQNYTSFLSKKCGFPVTVRDVLSGLTTLGQGYKNDNVDGYKIEEDLLLNSWFNLPIIYWLNADTVGTLFGPMSPGDMHFVRSDILDKWEHNINALLKYEDKSDIIRQPLKGVLEVFISQSYKSPDNFWPVYKRLLQNTLKRLESSDTGLVYKFFGYYILAELSKKGQEFIDEFEKIMRYNYPGLNTQPINTTPNKIAIVERILV